MAMHEVNHRYEIWGQVVDGQGVAVANTEVLITGVAGMPLGKGETDVNGRYRIVLHIHNANIGLPFWVSANGTIRAAKVVFNASDQKTPRDHQVDIRPAESDS